MPGPQPPAVTAVVVTHDRRELLLAALDALAAQTLPVARVLVVDNASSDGSATAVRERHPGVDLVVLPVNTGGAGGFAEGVRRALASPVDWLWLLDDDTLPSSTALAELLAAEARLAAEVPPVLLASRVLWTDGSEHAMNVPRERPDGRFADVARRHGAVSVRSASFVSVLVRASAAAATPPPVADYFIWNDDFEYTARLLRDAFGVLVPASEVTHATRAKTRADADPGPRFYYEVRNKAWALGRSSAFSPRERVLYAGAAALRWSRVLVRSSDRRTLLRALGRGARDGVLTRPRG